MTGIHTRCCPGCRCGSGSCLGIASGYAIRRCGKCSTLFTAQLPDVADAKDYEDFYSGGRDLAVPAFVSGRLVEAVAALEPYRRLNRWLDVGFGSGTLLRAISSQGWHPVGSEVAPTAVAAAQAGGFEAYLGEVGALDLPDAGFDVVSLVEVVEHVHDPDGLLADVMRLLRPGGALYLTTPNGRGIAARFLGVRWTVVCPPEHLQLFSVEGLRAALARGGFEPQVIRTDGLNPYELAFGFRRRPVVPDDHFHTSTSYRLNEALSTGRLRPIIKASLNAMLTATHLGDTLKVIAERQ